MKALVCTEFGAPLSLEDVTLPPLGLHDIRVRIEASGVCHSDLSAARGSGGPVPLPMILGHEGTGTVLEVGSQVTRCQPGDRVIGSFVPSCGDCWHCVRGESNHCDRFGEVFVSYGVARTDGTQALTMAGLGTFAEELTGHEDSFVPVQTELPSEELALIGCGVTTGVGAVLWTAQVQPGSTVAVFGCGGVGLSVVQGARIAGAERILAVDPVAMKRTAAEEFGATDLIDPSAGDPVEQLREATGGRGVDYAFEVVGSVDAATQACNAARKRGVVVLVGMPRFDAMLSIPVLPFMMEEKRILTTFYGSAQVQTHFPMLIRLAERGHLDLGKMVSKRIALKDVDDAFTAMEGGLVIRSVVVPT